MSEHPPEAASEASHEASHDASHDFQHIIYEVAEGVATLTLNRPDKLNSLMGAMMLELYSALGEAAQNASVRLLY